MNGETGRSLQLRIKEHRRALTDDDPCMSALAEHALNHHHDITLLGRMWQLLLLWTASVDTKKDHKRLSEKTHTQINASTFRHHCLHFLWSYFWRDFSINKMPQDLSISQSLYATVAALSTWWCSWNTDQGHPINNWTVRFVVSYCIVSKQSWIESPQY